MTISDKSNNFIGHLLNCPEEQKIESASSYLLSTLAKVPTYQWLKLTSHMEIIIKKIVATEQIFFSTLLFSLNIHVVYFFPLFTCEKRPKF